MEENDVLCVLVPLLESQPWMRKNKKGINEKFSDGRWYEVEGDEVFRLSKTEAQVTIAVLPGFSRALASNSPRAGLAFDLSRLPWQGS